MIGEFEKTINVFERELIKQKFWPEGMRNLVRRANKELPFLVYTLSSKGILILMRLPEKDIVLGVISNDRRKDQQEVTEKIDNFVKWFGE